MFTRGRLAVADAGWSSGSDASRLKPDTRKPPMRFVGDQRAGFFGQVVLRA